MSHPTHKAADDANLERAKAFVRSDLSAVQRAVLLELVWQKSTARTAARRLGISYPEVLRHSHEALHALARHLDRDRA
jgi:DNA-directed RNA polymerase specialized sigma24 family protein